MSFSKRLLSSATPGITPSEHFGVVLYEGDGTTSHSINGGKFGAGAYMLSPSSNTQYIALPDGIINGVAGNISVSFWMNTTYSSAQMFILATDITPYYSKIAINTETNGKLRFAYGNASNSENVFYTTSTNLLNGNWHHIVYTLDIANTTAKIYVNGSLETTHTTTITPGLVASPKLTIGNVYRSDTSAYQSNSFKGKLDQFRFFHKILSSSEVSTLYAETLATSTSLEPLGNETTDTLQVLGDSSCIATYRFENDEVDLSGNYDLTGNAIQYAAGRYGQAASFNGSSSYAQITSSAPQDSSGVMSVSFWAKTTSTSRACFFIAEGPSSAREFLKLENYGFQGTNSFRVSYNNNFLGNIDNEAISDGNWHHIVITAGGGNVKTYKDNSLLATQSVTITDQTLDHFVIGYRKYNNDLYFNGEIDQFRIFNKELSAAEVTTLYQENSLVASYRFEGNANDDTRNHDGTASNVTYEYGLGFTPDFIWCKTRSATGDHNLTDSTRGVQKGLNPNTNAVEGNQAPLGVTSFDTGGFTVSDNSGGGASVNGNGQDYVAWCLKANGGTTSSNTDGNSTSIVQVNPDAGFSIVKYVGNQTAGHRIGHGLGAVPQVIILKCLNNVARPWYVYHVGVDANNPSHYNLRLNGTDARQDSTTEFNDTEPTSTVFTLGTASGPNGSGADYIAYCFYSVEGFSKFGSYTGNGVSEGGPIIETGFEPAFVMIKNTNTANYGWYMFDNKRSPGKEKRLILRADTSAAEYDGGYYLEFLSNGFRINTNSGPANLNNGTFIYMAFAADPDTEKPTVAKSFTSVAYTGTGTNQKVEGLGFAPNLVWIKSRSTTNPHVLHDTVRGIGKVINSHLTNAEANESAYFTSVGYDYLQFGTNAGNYNNTGTNYVAWAWKADDNEPTINTVGSIDSLVSANANAGFSIVKWTTNGSASQTVGHGLSSTPELIFFKRLDSTQDWFVETNAIDGGYDYANLNTTAAFQDGGSAWSTRATSTTITAFTSSNNFKYVAYCFHSVAGYSKIGTFSGNSSTQSITGVGFQPDWVMIKRTDGTENWYIQDSVRGSTKQVYANLTNVEYNETGAITSFDSDGWTMGSYNGINNSGESYIYMAFKMN